MEVWVGANKRVSDCLSYCMGEDGSQILIQPVYLHTTRNCYPKVLFPVTECCQYLPVRTRKYLLRERVRELSIT